jgi:pyrimidine operon attenuation protein / uracil phosphoribosyltransferase
MADGDGSSRPDGLILMDSARIIRTLNRMACEILEDVPSIGGLAVLGVDVRGYDLARSLAKALEHHSGTAARIPCIRLAVRHGAGVVDGLSNLTAEKTDLIVVDDVLFSGTVMMKAIQRIIGHTTPGNLHIAVLVDRGHRRFPLSARYVGISSPTKLDEHVAVRFNNSGEPDSVILTHS